MDNCASKGDWLVKDLKNNKNWLFELDNQDKDEIIEATKYSISSRKKLYDITKSYFPLENLISKIKMIQKQLICLELLVLIGQLLHQT